MSGQGWFSRREPTLETRPKSSRVSGDLRASPEERASYSPRARSGRDLDELADEEEYEKPRPAKRKLSREKTRQKRRSVLGLLLYWGMVAGIWCVIGVTGLIVYHAGQLPPIDQLAVPKRPPNIAILGDDGVLLANRGDTGGPAVRLKDLPAYLPKAFVSIEDRRFYSHYGIDPVGIGRAIFRNVMRRGGMEGGSTLTQQLAKNLFLTQERTMSRKVQEAILALWLERKYSKDQILELYLNRVYFGSGAYGVEAAARKYFGHGAREVTLPEAAVLAGLMKAPSKLAPNRNPDGAADRAAQVVTSMAQEGHITEAMAKIALSNPAQVKRESGAGSINYAADHVMDILDDTLGAIDEDIVVTTTLNASLQGAAERALMDELDRQGARFGVSQGAFVALDVGGQVKALVGGRSYAESQFNRAVSARRQPGSAFKPFVYLAALERGLTPGSVREDSAVNIKGWQPENSTHKYLGPVNLTTALSLSLNTVAARLGQEVGAKGVIDAARRMGIASTLQPNASIALGTSEVTPLELVAAYSPFANGGIGVQAHVITKVRTADGKLLYQRKGASYGRIVEPQYVSMMNAMLMETLATGTGKRAGVPGWQAAGKTGTSQDYRDAWFVGYTSHLVAGVWLGNDDNSPTKKASGANVPVDIWNRFMREAHRGVPAAPLPSGLWRDPTQPTPPPSIRPPENIPIASNSPAGPLQLTGARAAAPTASPAAASKPAAAQTPRRDPIADLLPSASIPGGKPASRTATEKNFFEKLFGG